MAKKKTFRFPVFFLCMVLYAVVFLCGTKFGLDWFWGYMEDYELSQPKYAIENYMEQLTNETLYQGAAAQIAQLDGNLVTKEQCHAMIDQAVSGGITYAKNNKTSTSERHVYMLLSDGKTIGTVVTQPGEPNESGFRVWSATEESFDFSFLMGSGSSITVPHNFTVSVNGTALDESYIIQSNIPYECLEVFYGELDDLPYMITYQTPAVWGDQALLVTDDSGKTVTIDDPADNESFLYNCSQEESSRLETFSKEFIQQYMTFVSCNEAVRSREYLKLIEYIVDDSPLESRMYEAIDGLQWVKHTNKLLDIQINGCINLGNGRYLCDFSYTTQTNKYTSSSTDITNTKIILVEADGGLLAQSMQNY